MHSSSVRSTLCARRPFFVQLFCQSVVCLFPLPNGKWFWQRDRFILALANQRSLFHLGVILVPLLNPSEIPKSRCTPPHAARRPSTPFSNTPKKPGGRPMALKSVIIYYFVPCAAFASKMHKEGAWSLNGNATKNVDVVFIFYCCCCGLFLRKRYFECATSAYFRFFSAFSVTNRFAFSFVHIYMRVRIFYAHAHCTGQ